MGLQWRDFDGEQHSLAIVRTYTRGEIEFARSDALPYDADHLRRVVLYRAMSERALNGSRALTDFISSGTRRRVLSTP